MSGGTEKHKIFNEGIIVIFALMMTFMLFEAYKHKHHLKFGHEASLVCIIGLIISAIYMNSQSTEFADIMAFNDDLFFYFVLPPIIFSQGFNMYRKRFFDNIGNIVLFGVFGTFTTFAVFAACTIFTVENSSFNQWTMDAKTGDWIQSTVSLSTIEILLMSSLLCSTDVIAAVSLLKPKKQPKLFSLVFGEGILNDAVSIILFNTVNKYATHSDKEFDVKAVGFISLEFVMLGICSILIGVIFGLFQSYLMKKVRSLTREPVAECAIIFSVAYIAYVLAEMCHQSGIISLLTCGVTMAHYGWYNLSPQGQTSSAVVFQFLGFIAEGFVFSYLGLTFFSYRFMPFSPALIGFEFLFVLLGRSAATLGLIGLLKLCGYEKRAPSPVTFKEVFFICYAGLIRGAIAFGLVLRISPNFAGRDLIVTTCLSLVVFTTILFGSTIGLLGACLFPKHKEEEAEPVEGVVVDDDDYESASSESSHRSEIIHPNKQVLSQSTYNQMGDGFQRAQNSEVTDSQVPIVSQPTERRRSSKRSKKSGCWSYLQRFDEFCMKPIFIRKYTPEKERVADDFFNTYQEDGTSLERAFTLANKKKDSDAASAQKLLSHNDDGQEKSHQH